MKRALLILLVFLTIAACSAATLRQPEPPRIMCLNMGEVPGSGWWVYVCTFEGDTLDVLPLQEPTTA